MMIELITGMCMCNTILLVLAVNQTIIELITVMFNTIFCVLAVICMRRHISKIDQYTMCITCKRWLILLSGVKLKRDNNVVAQYISFWSNNGSL